MRSKAQHVYNPTLDLFLSKETQFGDKSTSLLDTAAKIWKTANDTYSQIGNTAQCYELRQMIHVTKQQELSLSQYYSKLRGMWQQLDFYGPFTAICDVDATAFKKWEEGLRVCDFLVCLNMEYDQIRATVLNRDPFTTLEQAYPMVQSEESRRTSMVHPVTQERSALLTSSYQTSYGVPPRTTSNRSTVDRSPVKCDFCDKEQHTREKCWKLHGRPQ
ncbi:uncharacterized protein LOC122668236 [Telopea speciosissima]|uniref:uncharacterized protein LOC122668236 n=1 Tax=Telopea speciosissima TaxID=54955 RepID=UPI001CC73B6A|nr:uncharacterized protein LOC122668236 [Telopea speciosissima]